MDNEFKGRYDEQRALLNETFTAIGKKAELILSVGQLLMENGASTDRIVRITKRVAAFMGIEEEKFHLHIMYTTLMLNISDEKNSHTSFRKCLKHAVDMRIISAISKLSWQAFSEHYTMEEFQGRLKEISARPRFYTEWQVVLAIGVACGAYGILFGCDMAAAIYTAFSAMFGRIVQIRCAKSGINAYVGISFAAFTATTAAYFAHFLPTQTPWQPIIACALFIVPGVPIINGLTDLLNTYLISGAARFLHTIMIVGGMAFGIVFSIGMFPVVDFTNLQTLHENSYIIFAIAAAIGAMGFAILFNLPPRLLFAVGCGGGLCVCIKNFLILECGVGPELGTLAGAMAVSIIAVKAIHWLHTPMQVLIVPAMIPLVPGVLIYRFLFAMINIRSLTLDQLLGAVQSGMDAALIILAIAIGATTPNIFAHRSFARQDKLKQVKLLREAYKD